MTPQLSLFGPAFCFYVVDVGVIVLVAVSINLLVLADEGALVERVLVRQVTRLCDLILRGVKDVAAVAAGSVLLASEDQDVSLRDGACSKPVLDISLQTCRPNLDQLPVRWMLVSSRIKSLNVRDRRLVPSKDVDEPLLNRDCG